MSNEFLEIEVISFFLYFYFIHTILYIYYYYNIILLYIGRLAKQLLAITFDLIEFRKKDK